MMPDSWKTFKSDDSRQHEVYEGKKLLIADVEIFGWLCFKKALRNALNPAKHTRSFEVFYMVEGSIDWIIDGKRVVLKGGEIMVINPHQTHFADSFIMQPCEHYWLRFKAISKGYFTGLSVKTTRSLVRSITKISGKSFKGGSEYEMLFNRMLDYHRNPGPFGTLSAQAIFQQILARLAEQGESYERPDESLPLHLQERLRRSIKLLEKENFEVIPSISLLASCAGLKETTYRRLFEKQFGFTPGHFITNHLISKAKICLREDKNITEVAHQLGFSTSQYFATVFKQWTGLRPSEFVHAVKVRKNNHIRFH